MTTPWVMFGSSHLFGDFFDLIRDSGGRLSRIVLNVPELPMKGRPKLQARLLRLPYHVEVLDLETFRPAPGEQYVMGFSRAIMAHLVTTLKERFKLQFTPLIHTKAILQYGADVAPGGVVNAGAILGSWAKVGSHAIVNRGANVGHDCMIGAYSFLAPGAVLCSHVKLDENVFVGAGAVVLPDIQVGRDAMIAAGAVVREDVPPGAMVAGVPGRVKKLRGHDL